MRSMLDVRSVLAAAVAALSLAGHAAGQSLDDVEFWVGSGSNRAGFVVDWNDGKNPQSLMWGLRWDGSATGGDMLTAIVNADSRLFGHVSTPGGFGVALYGRGYDLNASGNFAVSPSLVFPAGGLSVGSPVDGRAPADSADHWQEGWNSHGFWSYWLGSGTSPTWSFSGVGMSSRVLVNGGWDGWSYAPGFSSETPSMPVPAPIPAPGAAIVLGLGALFATRRRHVAVAAAGVAIAASAASAQFDPNNFAVEVVASSGLPATGLYNDPAAILGRPSTKFNNSFTPTPDFRRVKLIEPAFNSGLLGERLITTLNAGQSITVRMGRTVYDDPNNPFGIDLNVFGNAFFSVTSGGFVSDATNLNTTTVGGGVFSENVLVSVSPDNVNWYSYTGRTGDGLFPTNSYLWDRPAATWSNTDADPTLPINPALYSANFAGMTAADVLDLYDGSAGGTGFDLAQSGFSFINYVRVEGLTGFSGGEIDAIAAVSAVPAPGTLALLGIGMIASRRRRR